MYAKLINGTLRRAPNKVTNNGRLIYNPPSVMLLELGYLPVVYTDAPSESVDGKHYETAWVQSKTRITQVWNLVDNPELSESELSTEEALNIIMGGVINDQGAGRTI